MVEWDNFRTALEWAVDVADPETAADLVVPIGPWAVRALQSEHRLWVGRCLDLAVHGTRDRAPLLALAARWSGLAGDYEGARRLALEAIACGDPGPSTASGWVTVTFSCAMTGRLEEASGALAEAEAALGRCDDAFTFVEGNAVLHPLIVIASPERGGEHRDVVHRAARDLDNGIADAIVNRMDVVGHVRAGDIDKAAWLLPAAIDSAAQAQARGIEMDLRAMALGLLAPDDPVAPERFLDVLADLKRLDYGDTIWGVMELLGTIWARQGRTEEAATVLGHLRATGRRYPNPFVQALRVRFLDPVATGPDAAAGLATGAVMTRSELVNYGIGVLQAG